MIGSSASKCTPAIGGMPSRLYVGGHMCIHETYNLIRFYFKLDFPIEFSEQDFSVFGERTVFI